MLIPILAALLLLVTVYACIFEMVHCKIWYPRDTWKGLAISLPLFLWLVFTWS